MAHSCGSVLVHGMIILTYIITYITKLALNIPNLLCSCIEGNLSYNSVSGTVVPIFSYKPNCLDWAWPMSRLGVANV